MQLRLHRLAVAPDVASALAAIAGASLSAAPHTLTRVEVPVAEPVSVSEGIAWLHGAPVRSFWADREGALLVAGVGEAWHAGGLGWTRDTGLDALERGLADAPRRLRLFGGACFHGELRSRGPWKDFGAWRFALPRVELGRDAEGTWVAAHVQGSLSDPEAELARTRAALAAVAGRVAAVAQPLVALRTDDAPPLDAWTRSVRHALETLATTPLTKVVLARQRRVSLAEAPDAATLLARFAETEPAAFRFLLQPCADAAFFGASPERLLQLDGDHVASEALAGTRARGATGADDAALAEALLSSDKDRREHAAVVDMVARTLSEVASDVSVADAPSVMRLARVQHLHTPMRARRASTADAPHVERAPRPSGLAALLTALHPTPAVCGAPRAAAQAWLEAHEPFQRGLYAAPVGWVGGQRTADFTVAIRSALVEGATLSLFSGAGLVAGSDPAEEWREIDHKIAALWAAVTGQPRDRGGEA